MVRWVMIVGMILLSSAAWGQGQPPPLGMRDGTNPECRAGSNLMVVQPNSYSCNPDGTVSYDPVGAPPGTTAFQNILTGTNTGQNLTLGAGSSLGTAGGQINYNAGTVNFPALTHTGLTAGHMYVGDTAAGSLKAVAITSCNQVTEKPWWNPTTLTWDCVTDQGGVAAGQVRVTTNDTNDDFLDTKLTVDGSMSKAVQSPGGDERLQLSATPPLSNVSPGTTTQSGDYSFQGTANVDIQSQLRVPSSVSAPAVEREIKIAETGDGTLVNKPQLAFRSGAANIFIPAPLALPTADAQALTYNVATQEYIWQRPATVGVSAVDTTPHYLSSKLVAGANITLTPSGAGNETLTIASTGGGGGSPGAPVNGVQSNLDGANFRGSTRVQINPTTDVLEISCNRGVSGDCANALTSEAGPVSAPGAANTAETYVKQTGTTYDWCINGNGDTGERCMGAGGGTDELVGVDAADTPGYLGTKIVAGANIQIVTQGTTNKTLQINATGGGSGGNATDKSETFEMAACPDGSTPSRNWDAESGTTTPLCNASGITKASLEFDQANAACVVRHWYLPRTFDANAALNMRLLWESPDIAGTVTWEVATRCRNVGDARNSGTWTALTASADTVPNVATALAEKEFLNVPKPGCDKGSIFGFRLCKTAQTAASAALANVFELTFARSVEDITTGLLAHWELNETGSTTTAADSSGNGYDGTLIGFTLPGAWTGTGLTFDGANTIVDIVGSDTPGHPLSFTGNSGNFTFAYRYTHNASAGTLAAKRLDATADTQYQMNLNTGTPETAIWRVGSTSGQVDSPLTGAQQYDIAYVIENGTAKIYIDCVEQAYTGDAQPYTIVEELTPLTIGARRATPTTYANHLNGTLHDVRVYNRALGQSDLNGLCALPLQ